MLQQLLHPRKKSRDRSAGQVFLSPDLKCSNRSADNNWVPHRSVFFVVFVFQQLRCVGLDKSFYMENILIIRIILIISTKTTIATPSNQRSSGKCTINKHPRNTNRFHGQFRLTTPTGELETNYVFYTVWLPFCLNSTTPYLF